MASDFEVGSTVHYWIDSGSYVRCEVVMKVVPSLNGTNNYTKYFLPLALVGDWDWNHRIYNPAFYRNKILDGDYIEPSFVHIWEHPDFDREGRQDPTIMTALDLNMPSVIETRMKQKPIKSEVFRQMVIGVLRSESDPDEALNAAKSLLEYGFTYWR
jgi:hypothetical protein